MLGIPKNEGESRILKKVQELVQHLSEQHRHYVPRQNISIEENLMNYKEEKRKEETVACTNLKKFLQTFYVCDKCGVALCGV